MVHAMNICSLRVQDATRMTNDDAALSFAKEVSGHGVQDYPEITSSSSDSDVGSGGQAGSQEAQPAQVTFVMSLGVKQDNQTIPFQPRNTEPKWVNTLEQIFDSSGNATTTGVTAEFAEHIRGYVKSDEFRELIARTLGVKPQLLNV